jgi:ribonuclease HII
MLIGIDEVGRGAWAGPLVVAAVGLPVPVEGLCDSKILSPSKRAYLDQLIRRSAVCALGWVSAAEIDSLGLTESMRIAIHRALDGLEQDITRIVIDGKYNYLDYDHRAETVIRADTFIPEVSAASIIAKVARDSYMKRLACTYPDYEFENNKGYGTSKHHFALVTKGIVGEHRLSFNPIKGML